MILRYDKNKSKKRIPIGVFELYIKKFKFVKCNLKESNLAYTSLAYIVT